VCAFVCVYVCALLELNDIHTGYAIKKKLIDRVLIFNKLGSGLFFNGNLTEEIIRRINLNFLKI